MSTTSNSVPAGKENSILTVLSVSEVAEYLGVGKNRVYELLNDGSLKGFRMGGYLEDQPNGFGELYFECFGTLIQTDFHY